MITDKTAQALKIINDYDSHGRPITARIFAERMWPDSEKWQKVHNVGRNGATRGSGMWLAAGSYLAKLVNQKLVRMDMTPTKQKTFILTWRGGKALEEYEQNNT